MQRTARINRNAYYGLGLVIGIIACIMIGASGSATTHAVEAAEAISDRNQQLSEIQAFLGR